MQASPKKTDDIIRCRMVDLGMKHFRYVVNKPDIGVADLFGVIMVESFMEAIPKDGMEQEKYQLIRDAFVAFFKVIMYWLKLGFEYVENKGISNQGSVRSTK